MDNIEKVQDKTISDNQYVKYSAVMSIICGVILSMGALHMDTINWILPTIAQDLASGHSTLMVTSGFFYGMMIGHVLVLPLIDKIGKKPTMILGFIICIVGAFIGANAGALGGLIAARMIQGVGGAFSSTASRSVGGDAGKGKASAIALTFMQIWSALFPFFLPQLGKYVGNAFGWPAIFWLHAILCGILCVLTLIFVKETGQLKSQGVGVILNEVKQCLATREYVLFVLCFAFNMALFFCYAGSASFAMQTELGMDATTYANMYSVNALTMVVSAAIGRAIATKVSPDKIIKTMNVIQLVTAVFISLSFIMGFANWHWLMFVWWVFPFCQGINLPVAMSLVMNASGKATGTGAAFMGFVQYLFSSITTTMLASIRDTGSIGSVIGWIMGACAILSFVCCVAGAKVLRAKDASALD